MSTTLKARIEVCATNNINDNDSDLAELKRASNEINQKNQKNIIIGELDQPNDSVSCDPETDDWDTMFDDNEKCLDPKIIEELSASVGKVKIETTKMDYTAYHIKQELLIEEEYPRALEISNFPAYLKTPDLLILFNSCKQSGYDIKWVCSAETPCRSYPGISKKSQEVCRLNAAVQSQTLSKRRRSAAIRLE
uniref:Uncharacterized protein n=1 Tax=Megaselia scalaris TaxID=36166 RepID=T1H461_MEGSC